MKHLSKMALIFLALHGANLLAEGPRRGLPFVGDSLMTLSLGEEAGRDMMLFRDSLDENLFYIPYDRLSLVKEDEIPSFGLSYTINGALMSFTVQPSYDEDAFAKVKALTLAQQPLARFVPLPIAEGAYSLTIKTFDGERAVEAGNSIVQSSLGTPWSVSMSFKKETADTIITALKTGAVLGINFRYDFKAAILPSAVRISFDKEAIMENLGSSPLQTQSSLIRKLTDLQSRQSLRVYSIGNEAPIDHAMVFISRWILDQCFVAVGSSGLGEGFRFNRQECATRLQNDITITNSSTTKVTAIAGMSIGALCNVLPEHFAYQGPRHGINYGCPDRILPSTLADLNSQSAPRPLTYEQDARIPHFPASTLNND